MNLVHNIMAGRYRLAVELPRTWSLQIHECVAEQIIWKQPHFYFFFSPTQENWPLLLFTFPFLTASFGPGMGLRGGWPPRGQKADQSSLLMLMSGSLLSVRMKEECCSWTEQNCGFPATLWRKGWRYQWSNFRTFKHSAEVIRSGGSKHPSFSFTVDMKHSIFCCIRVWKQVEQDQHWWVAYRGLAQFAPKQQVVGECRAPECLCQVLTMQLKQHIIRAVGPYPRITGVAPKFMCIKAHTSAHTCKI